MKAGELLFKEEQKLKDSPVKWILIISMSLAVAGMIILSVTEAIPKNDIPIAFGLLIPVLIISYILIHSSRLITEISDEGIKLYWKPIKKRIVFIGKSEILNAEPRKAPPLQYGFGMWPGYGMIHNVSGRDGIQFYLRNGRKIFIGTQETFLFRKAIDKLTSLSRKIY